jgi:hypothetical protein
MTIEPSASERPTVDVAEVRAIAEDLYSALREHVRTGIMLARKIRQAHRARVSLAQGHPLPADQVGGGRRLAHRLRMVRREAGRHVLEVAPAHMSDRAAARTLGQALGLDPESGEIAEKLAERRYAMTGDYRAIEEWEPRIAQG